MRDQLPDETLFFGLEQARQKVPRWVADYNRNRPHSAIGYETPAAFMARLIAMDGRLGGAENAPPVIRCSIGATAPT